MATRQKYIKAYNDAYGTNYSYDDNTGKFVDSDGVAINDIDYTNNSKYANLTEEQKNNLQNWYDSYLNEESILKNTAEQRLQAAKTNDLYLKYLGVNNKMNGLEGQGIADSSLLRLQNNYMSALGGINSDSASRLSDNYRNAMNTERVNSEGAIAKAENEIASAVSNAYNSGMTFKEAQDKLKAAYKGNESLVDRYLAQYGNWAESSADYDGDNQIGSSNWFDVFDEKQTVDGVEKYTYEGTVVAKSDDIRGSGDYTVGQGIIDTDGHRWQIVKTGVPDSEVDKDIKRYGKINDDGNITKGSDGKYYMAVAGYDWIILKPIP